MKQFKPLVLFFAVFNLVFTTAFSQSTIEFSSDNFKTTTKLRTDMSAEELEKFRFKIPIDATFLKYDKVIVAGNFIHGGSRPSYLRDSRLIFYPKSATFKDNFEGKSEIIVSLLKMKVREEGIKYYLEKKDYGTISKIQNKLLGLAKKEKKAMYHKLKEKTEESA